MVTDDESHYVQPYIQVSEYAESHNLPIDHVIGLINDGKVAGQKRGNVWFVVNDEKSMGSAHAPSSCADLSLSHQLTANRKTTMTDNQNEIRTTSPTDKGFFAKLSSGDFGLAKTYWLYGVVVGTVSSFAMNLITSVGLLVPVLLAYTVYQVLVLMGTWRASSKYQGWKVWAVLAKIAVVLGVVMMFVTLATILTLLG